jgi:hypothetical protein
MEVTPFASRSSASRSATHGDASHSRKQGNEFIVTIGSPDLKIQRQIIGIDHALDFSLKIEAALKEEAGE